MLNAKALSDFLSQNSDDRLCKRWLLFTPKGTLLAYSKTNNIRDLRRQAAKAALLWQEQVESHHGLSGTDIEQQKASSAPGLTTLTFETESGNTIIRQIQPQLLLVLEGGVPPRKRTFEPRVTPEGPDDVPYPKSGATQAQGSQPGSFVSTTAQSVKSHASHSVLALQRRKLDALAAAIAEEFEETGFKMPGEGNAKVF